MRHPPLRSHSDVSTKVQRGGGGTKYKGAGGGGDNVQGGGGGKVRGGTRNWGGGGGDTKYKGGGGGGGGWGVWDSTCTHSLACHSEPPTQGALHPPKGLSPSPPVFCTREVQKQSPAEEKYPDWEWFLWSRAHPGSYF